MFSETNYLDFAENFWNKDEEQGNESQDYKNPKYLIEAYMQYQKMYDDIFSPGRFNEDILRTNHYNHIISRIYDMKSDYIIALFTELVQEQKNLSNSKTKFGIYLDEDKQYVFFIYLEGYNAPMMVHLKNIDFFKRNIEYYGSIPFYEKSPFGNELSLSILQKCDTTVKKEEFKKILAKKYNGGKITPDEICILLAAGKYPFKPSIKLEEHFNRASQGDDPPLL